MCIVVQQYEAIKIYFKVPRVIVLFAKLVSKGNLAQGDAEIKLCR